MNKRDLITLIGERTRMRNHDIQRVVEALLEVWLEEIASGGRIEIQNFLVLEVRTTRRQGALGRLVSGGRENQIPSHSRRVVVRPSKHLRRLMRQKLKRIGDHRDDPR